MHDVNDTHRHLFNRGNLIDAQKKGAVKKQPIAQNRSRSAVIRLLYGQDWQVETNVQAKFPAKARRLRKIDRCRKKEDFCQRILCFSSYAASKFTKFYCCCYYAKIRILQRRTTRDECFRSTDTTFSGWYCNVQNPIIR